ncbi:hypothetical protein [Leucobacter chromiireducens]|uniref:Lipoprotein n=1 Tax=Leucobacter chromiireducens subsp. chromiireducens TaxID=660067 RepID=A0ABS1SLV1_9MICO|nr:hypothetical protein [Leucobacter chromiireducens]MBL3689157.1 hypothetical protein [Leucobacter chromiireducens subsp. chromiireducens]
MLRFSTARHTRTAAGVATLALVAIPLSGCAIPSIGSGGSSAGSAGGTSGGTQSTCQVASEAIQRVTDEAGKEISQLVADGIAGNPVDAGALVDPAIEALDAATASITDPAVLTAIDAARVEWSGFAGDLGSLALPDLSGLGEGDLSAIGELQSYGSEVSALFTKRLPALQQTGQELQEACTAQ